MKKFLFGLLTLVLLLGVTGCDDDSEPKREEKPFIKEITVKPIEIEEIQVETILTEEIQVEEILYEDVTTYWD